MIAQSKIGCANQSKIGYVNRRKIPFVAPLDIVVERRRNDFAQVITWDFPTFGEKRKDFVSLCDAQHQAEPQLIYCQWVSLPNTVG